MITLGFFSYPQALLCYIFAENGVSLRVIQQLLGRTSLKTREIYTHITQKTLDECKSPLDELDEYLYLDQNIYAIEKQQKSALGYAHRTKTEGFAQPKGVFFGLGCVCKK